MKPNPELSLANDQIEPVPGISTQIGKGVTEFGYMEGVVLAPRAELRKTRFMLKKTDGKELSIQLTQEIPLREGHTVAMVWAENKEQKSDRWVGLINHNTEMIYTLDTVEHIFATKNGVNIIALLCLFFPVSFLYDNVFNGMDTFYIGYILSLVGGAVIWLITILMIDSKILRPLATKKFKKVLSPFLQAIYRSRSS